MTIQEIRNTPEIVNFMLDKSVIADSRMKLHKRLEEICELAIKALEQESVLDKIRAEIEQLKTYNRYTGESYLACEFREDVLYIIDKYKAESEK